MPDFLVKADYCGFLKILTGEILVPWQMEELIREFVNPTQINARIPWTGFSLEQHDTDALFCKRCETSLETEAVQNGP